MKSSIPASVVIVLAVLSLASSSQVVLFEHPNFIGESYIVSQYYDDCYTLPPEWDDRVSSLTSDAGCIAVYEHPGCQGRTKYITPYTRGQNNLAMLGFNDIISAVSQCSAFRRSDDKLKSA